ncbi:MAG: glucosaminidase domain-containing protein [Marinospirillum sp.]|uniref:glucosaminidase domain-containing protein n=1 Tax=Marinospirillum sp. TaxID=2183934 RepID=UPI0019E9FF96|nr:glucosaminidase domain-containing protein [Marinospirillum sp.]MBE0506298.1 glucosaminidase domain-containing protein [Marinospirillum sp.]
MPRTAVEHPVKPPLIFSFLLALSLLIAMAALINEWLAPKPSLQPFMGTEVDPLKQMPDYSNISHVPWRKEAFFNTLLPLVLYENQRIQWQREQLQIAKSLLDAGQELVASDQELVSEIAKYYALDWPLSENEWVTLMRRVDQVPLDLVLMQAANESAWGTSRFAQQGNNLFGQWCFSVGCGLVPEQRVPGMNHEVRRFATVLASVQAYMRNINTHRAYRQLRTIRGNLRAVDAEITGIDLAPGLISYSERRQAYVDEVISMIRSNQEFIELAIKSLSSEE